MSGLQPVSGDGLLARTGNLILLCATSPAALAEQLLAAHGEVAAAHGDATALADRIDALLGATEPAPAAVVFGPTKHGVAVAVFGQAWADVSTEHGDQRLALRHAQPGGLRSVLPGGLRSIRAGLGEIDASAQPDAWTRLEAGVVRARGLVFVPASAPAPAPAPAHQANEPLVGDDTPTHERPSPAPVPAAQLAPIPAPEPLPAPPEPAKPEIDRSQPFSAVVLVQAGTPAGPAPEERAPLPPVNAGTGPAGGPAHQDERPVILGVYCKNGHFDDPEARYCALCGISMAQQTLVPRPGPRPPLGVLVLDDGTVFTLDTDYVIGREPARDPSVEHGVARPLRIQDPGGVVSRAHARIELEGWRVKVVDLGSANGTGIQLPKESGWRRLPPKQSVVIVPGTRVGFGQREFRYESHRNT